MTEHGMLFSAPMVRAILEGRKTQTRRLAKFPDDNVLEVGMGCPAIERADGEIDAGPEVFAAWGEEWSVKPPHGPVGRRLWVRETFAVVPLHGTPDGHTWSVWQGLPFAQNRDTMEAAYYREGFDRSAPTWRPSIHMPRWASRITLEVTDVRVERVQQINDADIAAEGVTQEAVKALCSKIKIPTGLLPLELWERGWRAINGDASWESNPWVWVYDFRRLP